VLRLRKRLGIQFYIFNLIYPTLVFRMPQKCGMVIVVRYGVYSPRRRIVRETVEFLTITIPLNTWFWMADDTAPELNPSAG